MTSSSLSDSDATHLWDTLQERVARTMGRVSIVKFMQARDTDTARAQWIERVRAYTEALPRTGTLRVGASTDDPILVWDGVPAVLDVSTIEPSDAADGDWSTLIVPEWSPVLTDAAGRRRWGARWTDAVSDLRDLVDGGGRPPVVRADDDRPRPWYVQDPARRGPWPAFATQDGADAAAAAIAVGVAGLAALYDRWKETDA